MNINPAFEKLNSHKLARMLLFIGAFISIAWAAYFSIVTIAMPYQIELREGTALVTTKILMGGGNPYVLENQPLGLNVYGIGYSLAVLPFAFLFGNTLLLHRTITFIFILLSALIGATVVYKARKDVSLALGCGAFIMVGLIGQGGIGAFPAAMGSYLFLAAILILFTRSFDTGSLIISALATVVAFYTKPYFVLSFGVAATYLFLFVSKRKSILYSVLFLSLITICCGATRIIFPLYFINVIIGNVFLAVKSAEVLMDNLRSLFLHFYPVLALAVIIGVKDLLERKAQNLSGHNAKYIFDFSSFDKPFISCPVNYLFYAFVCSLMAFILVLGSHGGGTGMNYAYQLLTPLFFIWLFTKMNFNNNFRFILVVLLLSNLFGWGLGILNPNMLKQKDSKGWAELFNHIEASSNILNSQVIVSKTVEMGLIPIDSGQTIIFYEIQPFPENALIGPSYKDIYTRGFQYVTLIDRSMEKQRFDLIITTKEKAAFFHVKRLPQYYSVVAELVVDMPQTGQSWTVLLWKPLVE